MSEKTRSDRVRRDGTVEKPRITTCPPRSVASSSGENQAFLCRFEMGAQANTLGECKRERRTLRQHIAGKVTF